MEYACYREQKEATVNADIIIRFGMTPEERERFEVAMESLA